MSQRSNARKNRAASPSATAARAPSARLARVNPPAGSTANGLRRYRPSPSSSVPLGRRRGFLLAAGSVAVAAVLVLLGVAAMLARSPEAPNTTSFAQWPAAPSGSSLQNRLSAAGLPALKAEGTALHTHQHLDLVINGAPTLVPADVGVDNGAQIVSPIHTHDATGVIHVESPTVRDFTLGEFFRVWGVRLDANCIGNFCTAGTAQLKMWVNGQPYSGNPADLKLAEHQEIVVAYGTPDKIPSTPPSTYEWNGL